MSQFKIWRKRGSIGKCHNLVVYICRSEQRTGVFNDIQRQLADELKASVLKAETRHWCKVELNLHNDRPHYQANGTN